MKKVKVVNRMIIAELNAKEIAEKGHKYEVYSKMEWNFGAGFRYQEWEADSIAEAEEFANDYKRGTNK